MAIDHEELHALLTVDDVATLLKVSKSWVYEHTRSRGVHACRAVAPHQDWQVRALRSARRAHVLEQEASDDVIRSEIIATIGARLNPEEPTREKDVSRMARNKRQYGSGCLLKKGKGWAMRWRELEIAPDGKTRRVLRYESIGHVSSREASQALRPETGRSVRQ